LKPKKIPMRLCIACREGKPKKELLRIVKNQDGQVLCDATGKAPGRGAYICPTVECLDRAKKTRALSRALECDMTEETYEQLKRVILRREIGK